MPTNRENREAARYFRNRARLERMKAEKCRTAGFHAQAEHHERDAASFDARADAIERGEETRG